MRPVLIESQPTCPACQHEMTTDEMMGHDEDLFAIAPDEGRKDEAEERASDLTQVAQMLSECLRWIGDTQYAARMRCEPLIPDPPNNLKIRLAVFLASTPSEQQAANVEGPVAEIIASEITGLSVREIEGRWKFLRPGCKLYAGPNPARPGADPTQARGASGSPSSERPPAR